MRYGATNLHPAPSDGEVARILERAASAGIGWLDTAPAYGTAESVLGRLADVARTFRIATKISPLTPADGPAGAAVHASIVRSLERLHRDRLDVVLLHRATDLDGAAGDEIATALAAAKSQGLVSRIGASLYEPEDLDCVFAHISPDVVQVPLSPFDRRFATDDVRLRLQASGVAIHGRSLFLQGLLVAAEADLPGFAREHPAILGWRRWLADAGSSAVSTCLSTVLADPAVELGIVGVPTLAQLDEVLDAASVASQAPAPLDIFSPLAADLIDPRRWPPVQA